MQLVLALQYFSPCLHCWNALDRPQAVASLCSAVHTSQLHSLPQRILSSTVDWPNSMSNINELRKLRNLSWEGNLAWWDFDAAPQIKTSSQFAEDWKSDECFYLTVIIWSRATRLAGKPVSKHKHSYSPSMKNGSNSECDMASLPRSWESPLKETLFHRNLSRRRICFILQILQIGLQRSCVLACCLKWQVWRLAKSDSSFANRWKKFTEWIFCEFILWRDLLGGPAARPDQRRWGTDLRCWSAACRPRSHPEHDLGVKTARTRSAVRLVLRVCGAAAVN